LGPKRASRIRKLFNLSKEDDVRQYVVRKPLNKEGNGFGGGVYCATAAALLASPESGLPDFMFMALGLGMARILRLRRHSHFNTFENPLKHLMYM
jgi:hypothetical protein